MKRLTASSLRLAELCPASHALPVVEQAETEAQTAGTGRHKFLDDLAREGREAVLANVPAKAPWRPACEGIDTEQLLEGLLNIQSGIAYAFDVATGTVRRQSTEGHRQYDTTEAEIPGTLDWLALQANGRVLVIDFKGLEENDAAEDHVQLHYYALAAARDLRLVELDIAIVYVLPDGTLRWDRSSLGPFTLAAVHDRLARIHRRVAAARAEVVAGRIPDTHPGDHCSRCPAMPVCPAMVALARAFALAPDVPEGLARLSDVDAGAAWVRLELVEDALKLARAGLRARALLRGLPLPGGKMLVPSEGSSSSIDVDRALPVLRPRFGDQVDGLVERSLSVAAVERLARQIAPGRGQKKTVEALRADLTAAGALRTTTYVLLRVKSARATSSDALESPADGAEAAS